MLFPSIMNKNLFDDWFDFPDIDRKLYGRHANREMLMDVRDHEDHYEVELDLPGFKKDQIKIELKDGTLTITAAKGLDKDEKTKNGTYIRQERYAGMMSRSFYVGDQLKEEDIKAKFEDGVLTLNVPKNEPAKQIPEKHYITIE